MVQSLGKITVATPGTAVRVVSAASPVGVQSFMVQALPGNSGLIYVLREELVGASSVADQRTSLAKVIGIIGVSSSATAQPPAFSFTLPNGNVGEDMRRIWIDADQPNDGVLVSIAHSNGNPY